MIPKIIAIVLVLLIAAMGVIAYLETSGVTDIQGSIISRLGEIDSIQHHVALYQLGESGQEEIDKKKGELQEIIADYEEKKEGLSQRESELQRKERELLQFDESLDKRQESIEEQLNALGSEMDRAESLKRLADIYSNMGDNDAADIISQLNREMAAVIFDYMDARDVADILSAMDREIAVEISKLLGQE